MTTTPITTTPMTKALTVRERLEAILGADRIVLFMKGDRRQPRCGFSAAVVEILDNLLPDYRTIDVLADEELRQGIKEYGDWPTIPQLYIDGQLVGGCDIVTAMFHSGELHQALGLPPPDRTPPDVTVTDAARAHIAEALAEYPDTRLKLQIDANWQPRFSLVNQSGGEIAAQAGGLTVLLDPASAARAQGAVIDWRDTAGESGLAIDLPLAPPAVQDITAAALSELRRAEPDLLLIDTRPAAEAGAAAVPGARPLRDKDDLAALLALPKDRPLAFFCTHGHSSRGAAEYFRRQGHTRLYNLSGGSAAAGDAFAPD